MLLWALVSLAFNVAGTLVAGCAYRQDWKRYGAGRPLVPRPAWWPLGRSRHVHLVDAGLAVDVLMVAKATVAPSADATTEQLVDWLRRRRRTTRRRSATKCVSSTLRS